MCKWQSPSPNYTSKLQYEAEIFVNMNLWHKKLCSKFLIIWLLDVLTFSGPERRSDLKILIWRWSSITLAPIEGKGKQPYQQPFICRILGFFKYWKIYVSTGFIFHYSSHHLGHEVRGESFQHRWALLFEFIIRGMPHYTENRHIQMSVCALAVAILEY